MAVSFLLHFPDPCQPLEADSDGGRYPPPCPAEPGLSSPRSPGRFAEANRSAFRAATVRPACGSTFIILCWVRTIHPKSVVRVRSRIPKNVDGRWSARILANAATPCWLRTTDHGLRTNLMATVKF